LIKTHNLIEERIELGSDDLELTGRASQGLHGVHADGGGVVVGAANISKESLRLLLGELLVLCIKGTLMHSLGALTETKQGGDDEERCTELHG
jgi:hypothetical protein